MNRAIAACVWLFALSAALSAADVSEGLLRLIDADAGFVLVGNDLEASVAEFHRSPLAKRIEAWPAYQDWLQSEDHAKLVRSEVSISEAAGKPFPQVLRELFGEEFVLAAFPQEGERPSLLVAVRTPNDEAVAIGIAAWNTPRVEVARLSYGGHDYFERSRRRANGEKMRSLFYTSFGPVFILSEKTEPLKRAIDLHAAADAAGSVVGQPGFVDVARSIPTDESLWCYLRPRTWDGWFEPADFDPFGLPLVSEAWKTFDTVAASVRVESGLILEAVARCAEPKADDETVWNAAVSIGAVPSDAVVAYAGDFDFEEVENFIRHISSEEHLKKWTAQREVAASLFGGPGPLQEVTQALQRWEFYLVPHPKPAEARRPVDVVMSFPLGEPNSPGNTARMRDLLDRGVQGLLHFVAAMRNADAKGTPAVVRTARHAGEALRWIENYGRLTPASALTIDRLILATQPTLVRRALQLEANEELAAVPMFQRLAERYFAEARQLLFVDVVGIREFVGDQQEYLIERSMRIHSTPREKALEDVTELEDALRLIDSAFVSVRSEGGQTRFTVGAIVED